MNLIRYDVGFIILATVTLMLPGDRAKVMPETCIVCDTAEPRCPRSVLPGEVVFVDEPAVAAGRAQVYRYRRASSR